MLGFTLLYVVALCVKMRYVILCIKRLLTSDLMIQLRHSRSGSRVSDRGFSSFVSAVSSDSTQRRSSCSELDFGPRNSRSAGVSHGGHEACEQQHRTNYSRHPQHCTGQLLTYSIKIPLTLFKSRLKAHLFSSVYSS